MQNIINFILDNWESLSGIGLAVLTLFARLYPTQKNWDIVGGTLKTLDKIIPNLKRNKDDGSITRHCIVWLLFLLPMVSFSQNNVMGKGYFSYQGPYTSSIQDTTFIQGTRSNLQIGYGNSGGLYFDKARNKWRIWNGSQWTDLIKVSPGFANPMTTLGDIITGGVGGTPQRLGVGSNGQSLTISGGVPSWQTPTVYTSSNGITKTGNNFALGGTLLNGNTNLRGNNGANLFLGVINNSLSQFHVRIKGNETTNQLTFADSLHTQRVGFGRGNGLVYLADYSTNYTDRSMVDKNYADTRLAGLTFTNTPTLSNQVPSYNGTNWTFSNPSATPAGSDTQIQYNNSGAFGATSKLTYVAASDIMTIADATDQSNIISPSGLVINDVSTNSNITLNNNVSANPRITMSKSFQGLYLESNLVNTDNYIVSTGVPLKISAGETSEPGVLVTSTAANALVFAVTTDDGSSMISTREIAGVRDVTLSGKLNLDKGISTTANDGATINQISGRFRKDNTGAVYTLTNSFIDANSIIILTPANSAIDATATSWTTLAGAGSATITFNAAPTANFDMNFLVMN